MAPVCADDPRERGMIPGLSTHMPESIIYADESGLDVDTYISIYNAMGFLMQVEVDWIAQVIRNGEEAGDDHQADGRRPAPSLPGPLLRVEHPPATGHGHRRYHDARRGEGSDRPVLADAAGAAGQSETTRDPLQGLGEGQGLGEVASRPGTGSPRATGSPSPMSLCRPTYPWACLSPSLPPWASHHPSRRMSSRGRRRSDRGILVGPSSWDAATPHLPLTPTPSPRRCLCFD